MKPLYVHRTRECVLLASEIKAIRASGLYRDSVNWRVAARYLELLDLHSPRMRLGTASV